MIVFARVIYITLQSNFHEDLAGTGGAVDRLSCGPC